MNDKKANKPAKNPEGPFIGSVEIRIHGTPARTTAEVKLTGDNVEVATWMVTEGLRILHDNDEYIDGVIDDARQACDC